MLYIIPHVIINQACKIQSDFELIWGQGLPVVKSYYSQPQIPYVLIINATTCIHVHQFLGATSVLYMYMYLRI